MHHSLRDADWPTVGETGIINNNSIRLFSFIQIMLSVFKSYQHKTYMMWHIVWHIVGKGLRDCSGTLVVDCNVSAQMPKGRTIGRSRPEATCLEQDELISWSLPDTVSNFKHHILKLPPPCQKKMFKAKFKHDAIIGICQNKHIIHNELQHVQGSFLEFWGAASSLSALKKRLDTNKHSCCWMRKCPITCVLWHTIHNKLVHCIRLGCIACSGCGPSEDEKAPSF